MMPYPNPHPSPDSTPTLGGSTGWGPSVPVSHGGIPELILREREAWPQHGLSDLLDLHVLIVNLGESPHVTQKHTRALRIVPLPL